MKNRSEVIVKVINKSKHELPTYRPKPDESDRNSGMDVHANIGEPVVLHPGERAIIPTGIFVKLPENFEIQVRSRSGLAAKNGIMVTNSPGTVDESYVNKEIKVILCNTNQYTLSELIKNSFKKLFGIKSLDKKTFVINDGDRIAQFVLSPVVKCKWDTNWNPTPEEEDRKGEAGLGHSDK